MELTRRSSLDFQDPAAQKLPQKPRALWTSALSNAALSCVQMALSGECSPPLCWLDPRKSPVISVRRNAAGDEAFPLKDIRGQSLQSPRFANPSSFTTPRTTVVCKVAQFKMEPDLIQSDVSSVGPLCVGSKRSSSVEKTEVGQSRKNEECQ